MMDLFEAAADNAPALEKGFGRLKLALKPGEANHLQEFVDCVQHDGRLAINMRQSTLTSFLVLGRYMNMHEWARDRARNSSKCADEILREKLGRFYESRVAFDRHFEQGERFQYGTLNIGGIGAWPYGDYCVICSDGLVAGLRGIAYLQGDSLKTYVLPGPIVDEASIRHDVAPHSHRHLLAGLKLAPQVCHSPQDTWATLLCSGDDTVEGIFVASVAPRDVESVRIRRSDYDLYFEYAFEEFRQKLDEADRCLIGGFVMILRILKNNGIPLEVVPDA